MINLKQICKSIFLAVFFIYAAMPLSAADRYSVSSGNWNSTSTWSASSGGASGASVPIAGDNVYIESNHTITVTANAACANITFTGSGGTLNVNLSVTLTVSGSITLNILETGNTSCTISGSGSVSCANVNTGQAVYTPVQSVLLTHTILSTISSFNVSSDINLNSYKSGPMKRYANFNLQEGILDVSGSIISPGPPPKSTFSMETGAESGTLVLGGATPFNVSGADDILLEGVSTLVNYKREGNQTVLDETYTNLTLSGSGTKTLNGVTVSSILSIEGSAVASGTTPTYGAASTLQYKGSVAQTTGIEFPATFTGSGGVIIDNSNGVSLNSDKTIESNLNLVSGYLNAGSTTLIFQNSNTPIIKTSGTITTNSSTNIFFGTTGNTVGAAFTIPPGTFTSAPIINNLTINRTNSLTLGNQMISVKGIVLCNGPLNTAGNLTLVSDASATALIDGSGTGQITGNVTIQRYLPVGFGYKYFSSPFQSATVNEFGDDMDLTYWFPTFYKYDESRTSSGWVDYTTTTNVLQPMVGYAVNFGSFSVPNTVDVTGTVNNGALSLTLYNNNNTYTQGLNLVGNPYPSPIDWDAVGGWTKTNIDDAVYFFKASATDQYGGTYSSYISGVSSDGIVSNIIPSMQGFFVHVSDSAYPVTGTLGMNNSVRLTDQTQTFTKSLNLNESAKESPPLIRIATKFDDDNNSTDPMVFYLHQFASQSFDSDFDALKILNTDFNVPNLYTTLPDGKKLSINAISLFFDLPLRIPLGLKINRSGSISFALLYNDDYFPSNNIYIHDSLTGNRYLLEDDSNFSVNLDVGEYHNRFFLEIMSITTDIPEASLPDVIFEIYSSNELLKTNIYDVFGEEGILSVFNLTGQLVFKQVIRQAGYYEFKAPRYKGIYIVNYRSGTRSSSRKIFVGN